MGVTIKDIAEKTGVSRGTVDRALHNRGRIDPQVAQRIRETAQDMGYIPRKRKQPEKKNNVIKIGVVTQLAKSSFMIEVCRGIEKAGQELLDRGIELILKQGVSVDEKEQLALIEELEQEEINGLAIMPVDCESIRMKLNFLTEEKEIPVVTFNSDIVGTKRLCFVGMDNRKSGRTAAGLLGLLTRGKGKILIITGYFSNHVDNQRVDGFVEEMKVSYPEIEIAGVHGSFDETAQVERIIENVLKNDEEINGILVVSGGQAGVGQAFEKLKLIKRPYVIIYDQTRKNEKALMEDTVDFLIDQNGYVQGYRPPYILADLLTKGEVPKGEFLFTDINIKTKYNL